MNKKAMYNISCGLFVVTAQMSGKDNGCITNTLTQVTSDPDRVALTVNKANLTHDMIDATGCFTASVLSSEATFGLFERFGFKSGRDTDKFADLSGYKRGENGLYIITEGTNAYISGKVIGKTDLGTHTMFIADVTDMDILSNAPSATYEYYRQVIKPAPKAVGKTADGQTIWRCVICGYEYVGDELPEDFICPICKHPASDFEKVTADKPVEKSENQKTTWRCTVCGYEYEGDELPPDFKCPICGEGPDMFEKES